jgi:NADP-dependent 3-hydroxy acid dehydrogenase YdfG
VQFAQRQFDRVDVLINNAGVNLNILGEYLSVAISSPAVNMITVW